MVFYCRDDASQNYLAYIKHGGVQLDNYWFPQAFLALCGLQWGCASGYDIESADTVSLLMERLSHTQIKHLGSIMSISVDT